mgnify:CR=1 FL=1
MIKTLSKAQKMEREKFRIPRSVQDAIPIRRIFADGIFQVGNQYSKTWSFTDINYAIAGKEDKTSMFLDYSELLNALDSGASAKITIYNRRINKAEFERSVLLPDRDDGLDEYRHEFNRMLTAQVTGTSNSIVRERYLTVSVVKRNADEARSYFARVGTDLVTHLAQLFSVAQELTLTERLHIFRDFFKAGEQAAAEFNIHEHAKRGQHFKDWFCPDSMEFAADHFKLDARYGRVLYLQDYASYIKDSFVSELCDLDRDLMLSIDILPVPTDEAARQLQSTLLGVETNVANWQRRQNANNNFTATIPYDMELQRKETKEMLDDLTTRDQRMMFGLVTLVLLADNKEQLDSDTETLYSTARKHLCQLSTLRWQQKDGLDTVLPYGLRKIQALRTLTTESTAVLIPFRAQEIMQPNGLYYGQNAVSKNMIVADRRLLLNGNSFRLGVSGSGKSMSAKEEIVQIALSTEDDILILDPESEFGYLTEALGGEVISEDFPEGNANFVSYINNAKSADAGVIFAPVSTNYAQLIIEAASAQGFEGHLLGSDTWDDNMVLQAAKGTNVQVFVSTFYAEGGNKTFDDGIKAYINGNADAKTTNGGDDTISAVTAMGYDVYYVALEALKAAGSTDPAKVMEALPGVTYDGVSGHIAFDETGDAIRDTAYIKTIDTAANVWKFVTQQKAS